MTLENGIRITQNWPPSNEPGKSRKPMSVPYLENPPDIISINRGRQLLVDDFLVESSYNLKRVFHKPTYHKLNPILDHDKPWELNQNGDPYAAPFSGGVWFDEKDSLFKMWYSAGGGSHDQSNDGLITCYAESLNGIKWIKPTVGLFDKENVVDTTIQDCVTVWLDKNEKDDTKRFKMFINQFYEPGKVNMLLKYSADGIDWSDAAAASEDLFDRCSAWYNPFADKWILSLKTKTKFGRSRNYVEGNSPEPVVKTAKRNTDEKVKHWFTAWPDEPRHPDFPNVPPEIYNLDAIAYESLTLGFFSVWEGPENDVCDSLGIQKRNEVCLGYSRDGFHWDRPDMSPFLPVDQSESAWNWGNVQSTNGSPIIVGDSLYFYVSGRRNNPAWDTNMATGLGVLRRDGFASLDAKENEGSITTRNLAIEGRYLFVNADASEGQIAAEILDEEGNVIPGYSKKKSFIVQTNGTRLKVSWKEVDLLEALPEIVKIKFYLTNSSLYSFWVSEFETGESGGYTAGGGPGLHASGKDLPIILKNNNSYVEIQ